MERVIFQIDEEIVDLFGCEDLDLRLLDLRGPHRTGDVAGKSLSFQSPLQGPMQHTMSMADGASRQWTLVLAACLQDGTVPLLDVRGLELLQWDRAEVRQDLLLCELPIPLRSFGR